MKDLIEQQKENTEVFLKTSNNLVESTKKVRPECPDGDLLYDTERIILNRHNNFLHNLGIDKD